jgi:hypothetical protein
VCCGFGWKPIFSSNSVYFSNRLLRTVDRVTFDRSGVEFAELLIPELGRCKTFVSFLVRRDWIVLFVVYYFIGFLSSSEATFLLDFCREESPE